MKKRLFGLITICLLLSFCMCFGVACNSNKNTETTTTSAETEAPVTEAPTTEAPKTEAPTTEAPAADEGGCGSTVGVAGLALVAALGTCTVFVSKKRD